jgi:hypothetical protein
MTQIKNCPVELTELIQWLTVWKVNRELAFSAMPCTLYSYLRQENIIGQDWELKDETPAYLTEYPNTIELLSN